MANWTVTSSSIEQSPILFNNPPSGNLNVFNLTITGDFGYNISARNFIIGGGATEDTSDNPTSYYFSDGNLDGEVSHVVFTDNLEGGQPDNTVNVAVHMYNMPTTNSQFLVWPADGEFYIDIDDRPGDEISGDIPRMNCIQVGWDYDSNQTVTVIDLPDTVETGSLGDSSNKASFRFLSEKVEEGGDGTLVSQVKFEVSNASTMFYAETPNISITGLGIYDSTYRTEVIPTRTNGYITSFIASIYYTPPVVPADPSATWVFCGLDHTATINYTRKDSEVAATDEITNLTVTSSLNSSGGTTSIVVSGTPGSTYNLQGQLNKDVGNSSPGEAPAYYDFSPIGTGFQAFPTTNVSTLSSPHGVNLHQMQISETSETREFSVWILEDPNPASDTTLGSKVAKSPGELTFIQYGVSTATVQPYSFTHSSNYATLPTQSFTSNTRYENDSYPVPKTNSVAAFGGNGGVSGTRILLNTPVPPSINNGMVVAVKNTTGSSIITHGTTVSNIRGNVLTISSAASIPNGTRLFFENTNSSLVNFSLTVTADTGRNISLTGGSPNIRNIFSGIDTTVIKTGGSSSGTTIGFTGGSGEDAKASGIAIGMKMKGEGVIGKVDTDGQGFTTVTAVDMGNNVVTVADSQNSTFLGVSLTFSETDTYKSNPSVRLVDVQATAVDVNNIRFDGYFVYQELRSTGNITLNLDSVITNVAE